MADKKQAVVTALRGLAVSFGELSKAHRTAQSAIHEYAVEIEHSDSPENIINNFPALFGNLEGLNVTSSSKGKAAKTLVHADEDGNEEEGGKKKRATKEKKVKDPNAPKRPASAYIEYQNDVRDDFRERHSGLPYADVLKKIGESWASMTDAQKQPYQDIMERKKESYLSNKKEYDEQHGIVSKPSPAAASVSVGADGKEYTGKKRGRKSNAERALIAAAAATDAGRGETQTAAPSSAAASSSKQADIPVNAPSKKTVEESDDDSSDSDDDSSDSSEEESESSEEEPTPPPVVPPKKEKKSKGDKHKSKKSKTAA
ncbi:uncharacterized protein JCM6883_006882 [Sporobolomyces salmoneus]|uniref:uncharacterized protein n=1 Tax=Sporobolomyces salmoneus TaxID=183962 RepID=UPI00317C975B